MAGSYPDADTCQHPNPPVLTGTATTICRNETVTLTAVGCSGTIIWSTGETGPTLNVQPQQTTTYTAICRSQPGCISCFAEPWKVTVNTPKAPIVTSSSPLICPNDPVTLTATGCSGIIHWPDQMTGATWTGQLQQTTTFQATCEQNGCVSTVSAPVAVQVSAPTIPQPSVDKDELCAGQPVQLLASNCIGQVLWSDGGSGLSRTITPTRTITYRAICQIGSCRSDSSQPVTVVVRPTVATVNVTPTAMNGCPFQTADLTKSVQNSGNNASGYYVFRTGPSLDAPSVQSPWAVIGSTYYVFGRTADGCYTEPVAVAVTITPCQNAITPCLSNPATVTAQLDTLDWAKGVMQLRGQLGGSATQANWQSEGGGLFTSSDLSTRYILSEADRQRNTVTFTLKVPDPDGNGPCVGASANVTAAGPSLSPELVGLSKEVSTPSWLVDNNAQVVEVTYQFTAKNLGKHRLTNLQISDDLDAAFSAYGVMIQSVQVRADSNLVINPAYTGRRADTTLLLTGNLPAGGQSRVWLTVRLDVSQATTLTFTNRALAQAVDTNGAICRDWSTNGVDADPDKNGNPGDNNEPTLVTLHSTRPEVAENVFIPEGFSPNGDGLNDVFVIQGVPVGTSVQVQIYNRMGHLVYQTMNYKNDWDGTSNVGSVVSNAKQGLPDGTYYYQIRLSDGREFVRFMTLAR
ncbi:T9SS type B sorting domain-containing protein [Spirosoma fluminis]